MNLLKQVAAILGTATMIAVLVAIVSPKTAHAVAAALVQIEPGTTTHIGQNETELVSLVCLRSESYCFTISPEGTYGNSPYVVPSGDTLIVTDWQFFDDGAQPGVNTADVLTTTANPGYYAAEGAALPDTQGVYVADVKFTTGIRFGSGVTIYDYQASANRGMAYVQGYLVPN